ncbi:tripartite tricarboxylate transporter substrate binding protein [Oceanobacillus locisalsi]|uniref:Tripartite tricarboxylate transporter substrate binding protein n=1 Tax=Oceanobacillus locisalsi TaxID=546107 RepID=A0ABW3NJZ4_9BACI
MKKIVLIFLLFLLIIAGCSNSEGEADSSNGEENVLAGETIQMIVPHAAGGGSDVVARSIAAEAAENLDASIGVVNTPGGGGAVGMAEGAAAPADGLNLTFGTIELTMLPHLDLADVTYEDFEPVAQVNFDPAAITVPADAPYDTVEEFIEYAKNNPGEIRVGGSGFGAIWHLASETFALENDIELDFVPFDGAAPSITALLGGHIEAVTASPGEVLEQVEAGELKTLAVMSDERSDAMPDVPTLEEEGVEPVNTGLWRGVMVPKDTPDEVIEELQEAFLEAAESEEYEEFMSNNGFGISVKDADGFREDMENDHESFEEIINEAGLNE